MSPPGEPRIALFSGLRVEVGGREVTHDLPGRQGRILLSFLAARWPEAVSRDQLFAVVWPDSLPANPASDFRALLARLRRALWADAIEGRELLALGLPDGAQFDVRDAETQLATAEREDGLLALAAAETAAATLTQRFLDGMQGDWVEERRRHFGERARRAFELAARAGLAVGGNHLARSERAARELVAHDRFREDGYALLIEALAAQGNVAEAMRVYEELRVLLREELGTRPSAGVIALYERLLADDEVETSTVELPRVTERVRAGAFVGRDAFLARLRSAWEEALAGQTSVVLVSGPAGIGKTRLAAAFAEDVHAAGGAVLYGRADEEALATFQPFVEALRHLLTRGGETFASETARERQILSQLLPDVGLPADDVAAGTSEALRYRLFEAIAALLVRATSRWPVLLVLDDLHWADRPTLLLAQHLLRHPDLSRVLVIGTFRPVEDEPLADFLAGLRRDRRFDVLELEGLDVAATGALVEDRLGVEPTPGLVERLHEQTGGNAFFIEETVRALGADGLTEAALERVGVPEGISEVILRHVRHQSPLAAELLGMAAVVGRDFPLAVVERLFADDDVIAPLEEALAARLIVETSTPEVFSFAHAVVREVLYGQLTALGRPRAHLRVAQALEAGSAALNPAELAYHYDLARRPEPALKYSILAGQRAARLFSYEEAAGHYQRALDLLASEREKERCELLIALGRVQYQGSDRGAIETFRAAVDSARRRGDAEQFARATLGLGERFWEAAYVGQRYRELLQEAAAMLGTADSPWRSRVLARLAENLAFPVLDPTAAELSAEALDVARRLGDEDVLVQALLARHVTRLDIRDLDERLVLMEELLRRGGEKLGLSAERHQWRLYDLLEAGDVEAAREDHARLEALASELRQPLFQMLAAGWRGVLAELTGDLEVAEQSADECRRFAELAHARDAESTWAAKVFALRRRSGLLAEMAELTEQLAVQQRPGWPPALGILRAELGDLAGAQAILDEVLHDGPEAVPDGMFRLVNLALMADLCALVGDRVKAPGLYAALKPFAHRCVVIGYSSCWGPVDRFLAMLAETMGDAAAAEAHARAAVDRARAIGAPLLASDIERRHPDLGLAA